MDIIKFVKFCQYRSFHIIFLSGIREVWYLKTLLIGVLFTISSFSFKKVNIPFIINLLRDVSQN